MSISSKIRSWFSRGKDEQTLKNFDLLALVFGYNELAKTAPSLGEKVYCRLARDAAEAEYRRRGGELIRTDEEVVVTIRESPRVTFSVKDIDLMRKAVEEHDGLRELQSSGG